MQVTAGKIAQHQTWQKMKNHKHMKISILIILSFKRSWQREMFEFECEAANKIQPCKIFSRMLLMVCYLLAELQNLKIPVTL